jgi:hypothetical protein
MRVFGPDVSSAASFARPSRGDRGSEAAIPADQNYNALRHSSFFELNISDTKVVREYSTMVRPKQMSEQPRERTFEEIAKDWAKNNRFPRNDGSVRSFSQFVKLCARQTKAGQKKKSPALKGAGSKAVRPFRTIRMAAKAKITFEL